MRGASEGLLLGQAGALGALIWSDKCEHRNDSIGICRTNEMLGGMARKSYSKGLMKSRK